jgi:2-polyprenyl-3-methyl-5-hydroxy-6-metoxy-1,4-benzoquinol methylase
MVLERLSLEAVSANTVIASEHVHRYRAAAALCAGLRVVDLACGSGYGSAILRQTAASVVGVDNDAATVDMARATVGADTDIEFVAADAVEFLNRRLESDYDAVVCLEGLEHLTDLTGAVKALAALARAGTKLVVSVPNSRTFAEENEFHVTDFGYDEAMELRDKLGGAAVLYQFLAEGSLIRQKEPGPFDAEEVLPEHGDDAYANHFILCVNFGDGIEAAVPRARMHLAVAPFYNRHMLALERANRELWRENARLAREHLGTSDAAAGAVLLKLRTRAENAERRAASLEAELADLRHRVRILDTPRHVAVERMRERVMRSKWLYALVSRLMRIWNRP